MRGLSAAICSFVLAFAPLAASANVRAGDRAPALSLPATTGKPLALSGYTGKPVYLNFFASWCPPCNSEAPSVGKLAARYAKQGLTVIGVDEYEGATKAQGFLTQYHLPYPAVLDSDGAVYRAYGGIGLPVHVFIDRTGKIKLIRQGEMSPAEIEAAIKSVL